MPFLTLIIGFLMMILDIYAQINWIIKSIKPTNGNKYRKRTFSGNKL